jgi:hypothetical protein
MINDYLSSLSVNHIGITIPSSMRQTLQSEFNSPFIRDDTQGVWVCFVWDEMLKIFKEYITQEGRASNYAMGFHHVCYDLESREDLTILHKQLLTSRLAVRLTLPELSPAPQCNYVSFYKITGIGTVEFNVVNF